MVIPGMYFLVICCNEDCSYFSKILPSYIGSNGKFDIFHSCKLVRCGYCLLRITKIPAILFVSCVWGYRGLVKNEKKVTTETDKKAFRVEIFNHTKSLPWDWLVVHIKPLQNLILENVDCLDENKNFSDIIDDMILQFEKTTKESKYYKKYEKVRKFLNL